MFSAPLTPLSSTESSNPADWRSLPRKARAERHTVMKLMRMTRVQAAALTRLAEERGESEAEVMRKLVAREVGTVLEGRGDTGLRPSKLETAFTSAFMKAMLRNAKREIRERRASRR
jgi:hypothetical protein